MIPQIGGDIGWTDIINHAFRVLIFDRAGTIIDHGYRVKVDGSFKSYGYLLVESPIVSEPVKLPIMHKNDFLLAASIYDEPQLTKAVEQEELLVTYVPKPRLADGMEGTSNSLHFAITPRGTLERYYELDNNIHMTKPAPEKIFGALVWDDEFKINTEK